VAVSAHYVAAVIGKPRHYEFGGRKSSGHVGLNLGIEGVPTDQGMFDHRLYLGGSIINVRNRFEGKPASSKIASIANAHPGTFKACFKTTALPAIRPGAANRNTHQRKIPGHDGSRARRHGGSCSRWIHARGMDADQQFVLSPGGGTGTSFSSMTSGSPNR
jgi:hypothetical protein